MGQVVQLAGFGVGGMDRHQKYDGTSQGSINATPNRSNTTGVNNIELDSTECVEKVEAMVSTAILHQEDVWNLIMSLFPDVDLPYNNNNDPKSGLHENHLVRISTPLHVLNAIKEKLESSMDWCRLAQCRLKGILPDSSNN